ncbi:T9SS sorting signal type C domain-containing protein [Flavobacterium facile]|uniref:T9SS sorting signal type C domain-containing protein n=1 Tax=Flavobacterium facile TaxID=2893174 RepID=UPI002E7A68F2|nr:T9SS sorting signal type C domain-containing protein [Flavobacterium sp. T-12]
MKNKLLKISVLFVFIAFGCCFLYQNSNFNVLNSEINAKNKEENIAKPQAKTEKTTVGLVSVDSKPNFSNKILLSEVNKNKSNEKIVSNLKQNELDSIEKLREKYSAYLQNHPFAKTKQMSKSERKELALPPNAFYEQEWLYSSNPNLDRPEPEATLQLQESLRQIELSGRVPGDGLDNQWIERGPNNVGGRVRVLQFAPGSTTKVFAGGVAGGLWVNNDITSVASQWQPVNGVPGNLAVSCLTVDPNNSNIMYLGTGEVYTWGAVNGNGVYKSIDGGQNWINIFGAATATVANNIVYIQDIVAWNNPTTNQTEVFFGCDAMYYSEEVTQASGGTATYTYLGSNAIGLYRCTDGVNFARIDQASLKNASNRFYAPNKFAIGSDGKLWMGSKYNYIYGTAGGMVFSTTNGATWTNVRNLGNNGRVEIVASKQTPNKLYVLLQNESGVGDLAQFAVTTDGFATAPTYRTIPDDVDTGIPANDFTRGQNFYDLLIGIDPNNDDTLIIGGIDLFKTTNGGVNFTQISKWSNNNNLAALNVPVVHADHHCIAFANSSRLVMGNDGGIFYSNTGAIGATSIASRNNGLNITQFYKAAINQTGVSQKLLAGAQDNGSQFIDNAPGIPAASVSVSGGDGCWAFIDKQDEFMISSYVYNIYYRKNMSGGTLNTIVNNGNDGDFVNQCGYDSNSNILYTNGTAAATYRIYRFSGADLTTQATLSDALLNNIPTYLQPSPHTANRLLVGLANGRLLRLNSADGTPTWASIGDATWVGAVSDIRYGATENDIFVTFHNYGVVNVWYTANGGTSWQNKEGNLPNLPVKCILQNPNATNEVILGTELGVWYTVDFNAASPTWRRANNGMKDVKVLSFDYRSVDNTILAATFGRGMWTGQFWQCGTTTKTWDGTAWSPAGAPTKRDAVVFNGNYTSTASLDACSVTVNAGAAVTFVSGYSLRVGENITVNATGSLTINSGAALVQYTKHAVNTGNIIVKRISTNMIHNDYTAWSSPVVNQNLLAFSPNTLTNRFYQYLFTGTTTPTAYQSVVPSTNSFTLAKGYMIRVDNNFTLTPAPFNAQFSGVPNNGSITYAVGLGYNLLGNPYASPISANKFLINNPKTNALYYWTHTVAAVAGAFPQNNYASYTILGGTASAAGGAIPNDKINVGQGFFINATSAYTVSFENEFREDATTTTQFFKSSDATVGTSESEKHRIWINLNDSTKSYNQILVGYTANATNGVDNKIDGKMLDTSKTSLYNLIENSEYVIQGKGLPFSDEDTVKLGLKVTEASNFEINIQQVDGLFENQEVFVKDKYIGAIHNLKEGSYYFISQVGTFNDRFELIYKKPTKEVVISTTNAVDILVKNNELTIQTYQSAIASVEVYDVLGKVIFTKSGIHNKQFNTNQIKASQQTLIVKIQLENGEVVVKKIIM